MAVVFFKKINCINFFKKSPPASMPLLTFSHFCCRPRVPKATQRIKNSFGCFRLTQSTTKTVLLPCGSSCFFCGCLSNLKNVLLPLRYLSLVVGRAVVRVVRFLFLPSLLTSLPPFPAFSCACECSTFLVLTRGRAARRAALPERAPALFMP